MAHVPFNVEIPNFREVLASRVKRTQTTRAFLRDYVVTVEGDCLVTYTGEQLDANDWRFFDALVRFANGQFDVPCTVSCQELCLGLGLTSFETIGQILCRLNTPIYFCSKDGRRKDVVTLIGGFDCFNYETLTYTISSKVIHLLSIKN